MANNVELLRRSYEALAHGDVEPMLGLMDDKIEWYEAEHEARP